jgi:hypothetical protein
VRNGRLAPSSAGKSCWQSPAEDSSSEAVEHKEEAQVNHTVEDQGTLESYQKNAKSEFLLK